MRIKYALTACNNNPEYYQFWPAISRVWKEYLDIEPILVFVGEDLPDDINSDYGRIIKFAPIEGIPTSTQSQFIRLWYPQFFPDDIVITTDIDMIPLSKWFFINQLSSIDENRYVALNLPGVSYSICYNVAKGSIFKEILELRDSFEDTLVPFYREVERSGKRLWFTDEDYLADKLSGKDIDVIYRDMPSSRRIDRSRWVYNEGLLKLGSYYDCHAGRPYSRYKSEINKILNHILPGD